MKNKILLVIPISFLLLLTGIKDTGETKYSVIDSLSVRKINLSFVGDIMCHTPQIDYARIDRDSFDFKPVFRFIKQYIDQADISFGNLETVINGNKSKLSGYPLFNSPGELLAALSDTGFDFLFTSNNHCLDRGYQGIVNTNNNIREYGMTPVGTFRSQKESDSSIVIDVNGFRIGILAYTYGVNGNFFPKEYYYAVKLIDTTLIKSELLKLEHLNTDINLVYFHFGDEYALQPSRYQEIIVEKTFSYGADLIIASHPHVVQPIRYYEKQSGNLEKGIVAYSLGNFISNQRWRYSDAGVILNIELSKDFKDSVWISNSSIIPTWVYKGSTGTKNEFVIVPSDTLIHSIPGYYSQTDRKKSIQSYTDTYSNYELAK